MDVEVPVGAVVVGTDDSPGSRQAVAWAAVQACVENRPLVLAHAIPPVTGAWLDADGNQVRVGMSGPQPEAERIMALARRQVEEATGVRDLHELVRVAEARTLLSGLQADAAMCVVGSRGYGPVRSVLLGSVGRALARHPRCPVVIHRPLGDEAARHGVVAGVDESPRSAAVIEFAHRLARSRGTTLRLVHARWESGPVGGTATADVRQELDVLLALLRERHPGTPVETADLAGDPHEVLAQESERCALVVIGAHHTRRGGLLPAHVTTDVLEHARCPVAVVPSGA